MQIMENKNLKYDVVALGSSTIDCIFEVDDVMRMELIDPDRTIKKYVAIEYSSKVNVKQVKFYPGGSAANIACDLSNIGLRTAYIGGLGKDSSGETCLSDMKKHHVDVSGVHQFEDAATATSVIIISQWGKDRSILAYKGANDLYGPQYVPENMLKETRCFAWTSLTSEYGVKAIERCIEIAKASGALIAGAPSISIIKKRHEDAINLLRQCDITSMNDEELEALVGTKDIHEGIKILLDWGLKRVNITFGKEGQWITDGNKLVKTKPPKVFPKDTTGAGDATMSGLIYGTLMNKTLEETAKISAGLSAMEIEATGVRVGLPNKYSELEDFLKKHPIEQETLPFK